MVGHDFTDMPGRDVKTVGANPFETVSMLRCRFCLKTPSTAREDGCPPRVLEETGSVLLSDWNPEGVEYFKGRKCVTCGTPIMGHSLRKDSGEYWCPMLASQASQGVENCVHELNGVAAPQEAVQPTERTTDLDVKYTNRGDQNE